MKIVAFKYLYAKLGKNRDKKLYRLAKTRVRRDRDLNHVKCIKEEYVEV